MEYNNYEQKSQLFHSTKKYLKKKKVEKVKIVTIA